MRPETERFLSDFNSMAAIGALPSGGCERLSMSDEDILARKTLLKLLENADMQPFEDELAVIWGRIEGSDPDAAPVLVGSHIDTVRNGGKYDGLLGVMAGFEAMRRIKESKSAHRRPIELIVFPNEESARFNYPTVGSKLIAGKISPEKLKEMKDDSGLSLYDALKSRGFSPDDCGKSRARLKRAYSMVELHIEQGPLLEKLAVPIGVVSAIAAPTRLSVRITGEYAHSGACPTELRRDALAAAAELILAVESAGRSRCAEKTVAAVTLCNLQNPSMNVIPGCVDLVIDIRGIDSDSIKSCVEEVKRRLFEIADERKVAARLDVISSEEPVLMSRRMIDRISEICRQKGIKYEVMPSGAGHDAMNLAPILPTGMIFIPCKGGISHNPAEEIDINDFETAMELLCELLLREADSE